MPKVKANKKASRPRVAPTTAPIGASLSLSARWRLRLPRRQPSSTASASSPTTSDRRAGSRTGAASGIVDQPGLCVHEAQGVPFAFVQLEQAFEQVRPDGRSLADEHEAFGVFQPLGERAGAIIRSDAAVADSRFVVNYFRKTPDGRLLFGGGENYRPGFPSDLAGFVRRHMLKVYPQLADVPIDHAWGGTLGITMNRVPFVGEVAPGVRVASGYSGQGVMLAPYVGKLLAEAIEESAPGPVEALEAAVRAAFGVISIHNMPILDAFHVRQKIRFVSARGEAGACNMADSYARVSGTLGVCVTSTGTGCGNAAGAMVEAITAGTPLLHLTGQIESPFLDRDLGYIHEHPAQLAMLKSVGKDAFRIRNPETALATLREAVRIAQTPPCGPVSIEIPIDVQKMLLDLSRPN